ncbi:MAG: amidase [Betaproteobacteria bacterium]
MNDPLWQWSTGELARAIRTRRISSREALRSILGRVAEVNPRINAVVDLMADEAYAAADRADAAVKTGEPLGVLHGVPVSVKINVDYAGRATTNGVVAFKDRIAKEDSAPVANLRKAGAVLFGRTNTPAFSHRAFTDNDLHGRTLNPWDAARTPGGSSGGAAAAVASGMGPIAHGNDRAGSVRYPAFACGVYGLRPSIGRVPDLQPSAVEERGLFTQLTLVHGTLARSIDDLRLSLAALETPDHRDPWAFPAAPRPPQRPSAVAMVSSLPGVTADAAITAAVRKAGALLEAAGYRVEEIAPPDYVEAATMFWKLLMTEERAASANETASSTRAIELYGDEAVKRVRAGNKAYAGEYDFDGYVRALARRTTILRKWRMFLARYPLILTPVSWVLPFPIDYDQCGNDAMRHTIETCHPLLTVSTLGLASIAVPTGFAEGVPVGVQLVADRFQEETCFTAGEIIEAGCPFGFPPAAATRP